MNTGLYGAHSIPISRLLAGAWFIFILGLIPAAVDARQPQVATTAPPSQSADVEPPPVVVGAGDVLHLYPTGGATAFSSRSADQDWAYDPTSVYDQKGTSAPRGFSAQAPNELIDPFSGNLILHHTDLHLPGVAGLDLTLQRVYNSKIHRNYAKRTTDPNGMLFVPASAVGLGWSLHLGRLVGAVDSGPNNALPGPRYYERPDGSQHPFFTYQGAGCGDGNNDVCLITKQQENPYRESIEEPWRLATADGRNITFGHEAFDGSTVVHYATEIRDVHGNRIQISYHDNTIPGIAVQREIFHHFIDTIVDSAGRRIDFNYSVVNAADGVRLTSITAVGRTVRYIYSSTNPWPQTQAFLVRAEPPAGAPWRYEYGGLNSGDCADNSKRWCELTRITYPQGGTIEYTFDDLTFWTHGNPASVRAVTERTIGGRAIDTATWTYQYNRGNSYSGDQHTVITRPGGSQEIYTYFGVGSGTYDPWGNAWQAGTLRQKRITEGGATLQTEIFEWEPSPAISGELWGDPWIGFDVGVFVPRLRQHTLQRGDLTWTTIHTSYNPFNNTPRCTTETASDGTRRYRLNTYAAVIAQQGDWLFRFFNLAQIESLRYNAFPSTNCDPSQTSSVQPGAEDEMIARRYTSEGQLESQEINGARTDYVYNGNGTLRAEITYQGADGTDGFCTTHGDYQVGVARQIGYGAPAPGCSSPLYTVQRTLNNDGSVATETNGRGYATGFSYDGLGRLTEIRPPGEAAIAISHEANSTRRRVTQAGYWMETGFDGFGRELTTQTAAGIHTRRAYDALGRVRFHGLPVTSANSDEGETFTYDGLGRVSGVTRTDGNSASYVYGTSMHTVTYTDEENRQTVYTYRAFGHPDDAWLVRVQLPGEPAPDTDTYTYLVGGHLSSINYGGRQRTLRYNYAKQVTSEYKPESGWMIYGYDAAGNLRCRDRNSSVACSDSNWNDERAEVRYTVDGLGRVGRVEYNGTVTPDVTFTYDNAGNLKTMRDGAGDHTFDYTPTDRLMQRVSVVNGVSYATRYTYDSRGNLETLTYPSGRVVTYGRDVGNRIDSVRDATTTYISDMDYHPNGMTSRIVYGNGVVTTLTQDSRLRPDRLSSSHGVLDLNYDFSPTGNLTRLTDGVNGSNSATFGYDDLDRLEDAAGAWGALHYDYNDAGDRIGETYNGTGATYRYDGRGLLEELSGRVDLTFTYDGYGNVTGRGEGAFYTYDVENRMITVAGSTSVRYHYDGQHQRTVVERPGCNNSRVYHYDGQGNRISETTQEGVFLKEYIVAGDRTVAEIDATPLQVAPAAIDFGDVVANVGASVPMTLTNRSDQTLLLDKVSLDWPFGLGISLPLEIPPGQSMAVPVTFNSYERGTYATTLSGCSGGLQFSIALQGRSVAALAEVAPYEFDLGDVPLGTVLTRTVILSSTGDLPLHITGWQVDDPALSIQPADTATLQPGATRRLILTFDSSQTCGGLYQRNLLLESNSLYAAAVTIKANVLGLTVNTGTLNFAPLEAGNSRTLNATLTNRALVPLTPVHTLSGAPGFQAMVPRSQLPPGASVEIAITYRPTNTLWSPLGDHATLGLGQEGCAADCTTRLHLAGNVAAQIVPGGGGSPALAWLGESLHVASVVNNGTVTNPDPALAYAVRDSAGTWIEETGATGASQKGEQPALVAGPNGRLTLLWQERGAYAQLHLRQRDNSGTWGNVCIQSGRRSGWGPLATDGAGNVWLAWLDSVSNGWHAHPIFSATGACQANQTPSVQAAGNWGHLNLVAGPGDMLRLAAARSEALWSAVITPTGSTPALEMPAPANVAYETSPAQATDAAGGWHVAWSEIRLGVDYDPKLRYVYRSSTGSWSQPVTLFTGRWGGGGPQIALDDSDGVHIVWSDMACALADRPMLYYATRPTPGSDWQVSMVSTPGYSGFDRSPALIARGDRVVAAWGAYASATDPVQLLVGETRVDPSAKPPASGYRLHLPTVQR